MTAAQASVEDVRRYWDEKPLLSMELAAPLGTREYLAAFDPIREDLERFCVHLWEFEKHAGERVLDIGCGAPAYLVRQFARGGARITGVDLSPRTIEVAKKHIEAVGLTATVQVGNAEQLEFPDASFDFVTSAGVLHHTPDTKKAVAEVFRVLRPGGRAVIQLYYRSVLLRQPGWFFTRLALRLLLRSVPGREAMARPSSVDEFVRMWDGDSNPVGKAYDRRALRELFKAFEIEKMEPHVFHRRFLKVPLGPFYRLADRYAASTVYAVLKKPDKNA